VAVILNGRKKVNIGKPVMRSADEAEPLPLFRTFPALATKLPHVSLGIFPTPVEKVDPLGSALGLDRFYMKRDDLSGAVYGGNKVRMLEFLLGGALRANAREVVTVGYAGSNHALALAIYADRLGLKCSSYLLPQANAHYVRRNLLASYRHHARLHACGNYLSLAGGVLGGLIRATFQNGTLPGFIQPGGSSPLGIAGYINAGFELKEQIDAGLLPEPDRIYVPLGSMGTTIGLMLGLKVAGVRSRIIAVRVLEEHLASPWLLRRRYRDTSAFLHKLDPAFLKLDYPRESLEIRNDCLGKGYAHYTAKDVESAALMREHCGIILSGTYSAKAFSAVIDDAAKGILKDKTILFWNTYNSRDLSPLTADLDYPVLPRGFHRYFKEDVQPLDEGGFDR
jgi:1-aminocyclopropane-1-carboxylate deaminase/D-cysteine desulfhydrase-like pyridoxal-dependent ACC family enzyme